MLRFATKANLSGIRPDYTNNVFSEWTWPAIRKGEIFMGITLRTGNQSSRDEDNPILYEQKR